MTEGADRRSYRSVHGISPQAVREYLLIGAFTLLILVSATQIKTFPPSAVEYTAQFGDGNALRQGLYSFCFLAVLVASRPVHIGWRLVALPPGVLLLLLFCVASVLWSDVPGVAVRRLVLTFMILWIVFRCVDELGYQRALDVLTTTLLVLLAINYFYVALMPGAIHQGGDALDAGLAGNWHGLVPHKNETGPILAETIILLAFGCGRLRGKWRLLAIAAAAYFLYRTQSKTSVGLIFVALVAGVAFLRYSPAYRALFIPALMLLAALLTFGATIYVPQIVEALDSSEDAFTGRIQIWRTMTAYLSDHWYLGAGFGSFWDTGAVSPANIYGRSWVSTMVSQGHNGYLDLWTQIGLFGLLLAVVVLLVLPAARLLVAPVASRHYGAAVAAMLVFLIGHNVTETSMLARDYFGNLALACVVAAIYDLSRADRPAASRSRVGRRHLPVARRRAGLS